MMSEADTQDSCEVAIVGAGPIGLLLAGELASQDIHTVVLERAGSRSLEPKANGIVGHSALELAKRGVLAGTGLRVVTPPRFQFGPLVLKLGRGLRNPLHILPIPQHRLEELLERWARGHGAQVCRGQEVTGFTQDDSRVVVDVRSGDTTTQISARFLVRCDGARSLVRKLSGIGFPGFTSDHIARMARVTIPSTAIIRKDDGFEIAGVGRVAAMRPNPLPGGSFSIAPASTLDHDAPKDLYIISAHEARRDANPDDTVPIDELRSSLRRVLGAELPFTAATAIRSAIGNSRQADAYRIGRVFLAGDAAHIFNAGGSSLNVGLRDALDLAQRLTAVLRRGGAMDELDAYEAVRRSAGDRALQHTRAQAALSRNDDGIRALRPIISQLLTNRTSARSLARLLENC